MGSSAKILVVDDERSIRELLEIFLKKEGFDVQTARSAEEALERTKTFEFDLIVSDIKMADMSGIDLLRHLRAVNFNGQFIQHKNRRLLASFANSGRTFLPHFCSSGNKEPGC